MEDAMGLFDAKTTIRSSLSFLTDVKKKLEEPGNDKRDTLFRATVFSKWLDLPPYANDNLLLNYIFQHQERIFKKKAKNKPNQARDGKDQVKSKSKARLLGMIGPAIQTFPTDKANLGSLTKKGRKDKPHFILYCRFTNIIICHLGRTHNIHQRLASPLHLAKEDLKLGNLKFVPKGEDDEVFGMPIPNELISNNIRNTSYYNAYLEMVAKHDRKIADEKGGKKNPATAKQPKPKPAKDKSSKPAPAPKPKVTKEKPSKPSPAKHPKRGKVQKLRKGKPSLQLINEDEPTQPEHEPKH
ncbi:hypothetical protein Tco_0384760 [Tanacetum coccineum]